MSRPIDAAEPSDAEFEGFLRDAEDGVISSDTGLSPALDDMLIRIAIAADDELREAALRAARRIRAEERGA